MPSALYAIRSLSQLLKCAIVSAKQTTDNTTWIGIAVFQQNFTYEKRVADYIWLQFADLN